MTERRALVYLLRPVCPGAVHLPQGNWKESAEGQRKESLPRGSCQNMPAEFVHLHVHTQYSFLVSTVKLRQAGFGACYDTEDTLRYWIGEMQRRRLLPSPA